MDKYKQFILDIIINRGRFAVPDGEYKERHHIIPKCMGGSDDEENLVHLYAKEHLVAHKLLADIYPCHDKVQYTLDRMLDYKKYDGALSPAEYERAKKKKSERMSGENHPMKRPEVAAKAAAKQSKPVEAVDPESGQRVLFFKSAMDAERAGFDEGHISKCCNGKRKTHRGYCWTFVKGGDKDDGDNRG